MIKKKKECQPRSSAIWGELSHKIQKPKKKKLKKKWREKKEHRDQSKTKIRGKKPNNVLQETRESATSKNKNNIV